MDENKITKQGLILSVGTLVNDSDSGLDVEITDDMLTQAYEVQGVLTSGFMLMATALSRMKNYKLYLVFGFHSFSEYCKNALPFSARNAYHYAVLGERIQGVLGDDLPNKEIGNLGFWKLKTLAEKAEGEFERLLTDGKIQLGEEELSTDDIAKETIKSLKKKIERLEKSNDKNDLLVSENERLQLEKSYLLEKNEQLQEFYKSNVETVETEAENKIKIQEAWDLMSKAYTLINQCNFDVMSEKGQGDLIFLVKGIRDRWDTLVKSRPRLAELLCGYHEMIDGEVE